MAAVLYNSVAGSLLCQVMYSLLLLPLGTVQPLLSHLLALLEQLNDFNRLLPETGLLEEQELGMETQKTCLGQWNFDLPAMGHIDLCLITVLSVTCIDLKNRWHRLFLQEKI